MHRAISPAAPDSHTARVQQGGDSWVNTRSCRTTLYELLGRMCKCKCPCPFCMLCPPAFLCWGAPYHVLYHWIWHCKHGIAALLELLEYSWLWWCADTYWSLESSPEPLQERRSLPAQVINPGRSQTSPCCGLGFLWTRITALPFLPRSSPRQLQQSHCGTSKT